MLNSFLTEGVFIFHKLILRFNLESFIASLFINTKQKIIIY